MYVVIIAHRLTVFQLANFTDRAIDNTGCNTCGFYMIHNRGTSDSDITLPRSKFIICYYKYFLYYGGTNWRPYYRFLKLKTILASSLVICYMVYPQKHPYGSVFTSATRSPRLSDEENGL